MVPSRSSAISTSVLAPLPSIPETHLSDKDSEVISDEDSGTDSDYERFESYMRQDVGDAEFERTCLDG